MRLPDADNAIIEESKLKDYLLSETHPVGRFKAKVFRNIGFDESNVSKFCDALFTVGSQNNVESEQLTAYGVKYIVRGTISGPAGDLEILTVWIIEDGKRNPRLVTAYPDNSQLEQ